MPESFLLFFVCMFLGETRLRRRCGAVLFLLWIGTMGVLCFFLVKCRDNSLFVFCVYVFGGTRLRRCCGAVLLLLWIGTMGVLCFFTVKCCFISLFLPPTGCVLFSFKSVGGCVERGLLGACWGQVCILAGLWGDLSHLEGFVFSSFHQFAFAWTFIVDAA